MTELGSVKPSVTVRVVEGDILAMSADAIVNPWNRNYWPRKILAPGGLSGQIKKRTTDEPWRQLAKFGMLPTGDVVVTGTGGASPDTGESSMRSASLSIGKRHRKVWLNVHVTSCAARASLACVA